MRSAPRLQLAACILILVGYAGLSHYSNSDPPAPDLGAALALAPLFCVGFALLWRWAGRVAAIAAAAATALLLQRFWPVFAREFLVLSLLQQCGFYTPHGVELRPVPAARPRAAVHTACRQATRSAERARAALYAAV